MGKVIRCLALAVLAMALSTPAGATWWQARTDHFILNVDDTQDNARDFASRLERFDAALHQLYNTPQNPDLLFRPVTVYALRENDFFTACGCPGVVGVHYARTEGSFILSLYTPKADQKTKVGALNSQAVLLHEYSHHFMFSNFPVAYPYWFTEGFAEFNANVTFESDGSLLMGHPANYRGQSLLDGSRIPIKKLLSPDQYGFSDNMDLVYGRGWLLTHYLILNPARSGQLAAYLEAMNKGIPSYQAAQAFGDLKKLDTELDAYAHGKLNLLRIPPPKTPIDVKVTPMPEGVATMLPLYAAFRSGIGKSERLKYALGAAAIGRKYPDDPVVQTQLSEFELFAIRLDRADAAADRALAIDPGVVDALVDKGRIAIARLLQSKGSSDAAAWTNARAWFLKANRTQPDLVTPLFYYYRSFVVAHTKPTPGAVKGLMRAEVLAPESPEIGLLLARHELDDGDAALARRLLAPLAFAPHYGPSKNILLEALQLIDAGKIDEAKTALIVKKEDEDL